MTHDTPPSRGRTVALVLGVIGVAALVSCLLVGLLLKKVGDELFAPAAWKADAIAEADFPKAFGVRFPSRPVVLRSRVDGFQDLIYEGLAKLPPGGKEAFLAANGLKAAPADLVPVSDLESAQAELRAQQPGAGAITVTPLDGPADLQSADGGFVELFRSSALLEVDGETWVYLVAFST
ncbi:MAG: hypothetical protein AB1730_27920 [Myxococcota bacterium]